MTSNKKIECTLFTHKKSQLVSKYLHHNIRLTIQHSKLCYWISIIYFEAHIIKNGTDSQKTPLRSNILSQTVKIVNSFSALNFLTSNNRIRVLYFKTNIQICHETKIVMKLIFRTANIDSH
jgi:hypothetical protein